MGPTATSRAEYWQGMRRQQCPHYDMNSIVFVHCNNADVGGSDLNMFRLACASVEQGYEVQVVVRVLNAVADRYRQQGIKLTQLPMQRVSRTRNPVVHARWLCSLVTSSIRLARLYRRVKPDLVFVNDYNELAGLIAARWMGLPSVAMIRLTFDAPAILRRFYMGTIASLADRVLCNSDFVRGFNFGDLRRHKNVQTEYNWYEPPARSNNVTSQRDTLRMFGIPDGSRVILMPGRLEHWKGQHVLVEAASQIFSQVDDAVVLFVGSPVSGRGRAAYREQLSRRAAELGIANRVFFHDHVDDIESLYHAATVVVHCSVKPEPFGMTVLEAMWYGKPLVASAAGGVIETVGLPAAALLHEPGNATDLADKLLRILTDQAGASALVELGRARASEFSKDARWPEFHNTFVEVQNGGHRHGVGRKHRSRIKASEHG